MDFDVIKWLAGLTGFSFSNEVLVRVARENGILEQQDFTEITDETKYRCERDLLLTVICGPNTTPSQSNTHGNFTRSTGQQIVSATNIKLALARLRRLYKLLGEDDSDLPDLGSNLVWRD